MPKAVAVCTCKMCNTTFEKTTVKHSSREAHEWEVWAVSHFDMCPACHGKSQIATSTEPVVEMHYSEYKNNYADCKAVDGSYDKSTKTIKVIISKRRQFVDEILKMYPEENVADLTMAAKYMYDHHDDAEYMRDANPDIIPILNKYL